MSKAAEIKLVGASTEQLLAKIKEIREWDNGANFSIIATAGHMHHMDSIDNIEAAIKGDLAGYIRMNLPMRGTVLKCGGDNTLHYVENPDLEGRRCKRSNFKTGSNFTPKKKKRK